MLPCVSVENMRLSDTYTIDNFCPSGRTAIVVGSGNNGGDGFALASILHEHGFSCTVFTLSQKLSPDSSYYADQCKRIGVSICTFSAGCLDAYDIVVDCLLGTGFSRPVRDNYREAIKAINASSAYVVSVDINSGMNGDTGEAELAVYSDLTVTIGYIKTGLVTENAGNYIKRLVCADIGIILLREEGFISEENLPSWLDPKVLNAVE